jgi:hypothetical protein
VRTCKPADCDLQTLQQTADRLRQANQQLSRAGKLRDAAKKSLSDWLRNNRQIDIEALPVGEIVVIEGIALIEIDSQNRFDEDAFLLSDPEKHAAFRKELPIRKIKPL